MLGVFSVLYYLVVLTVTCILLVFFALIYVVSKPFDKKGTILHCISRLWTRMFFVLGPKWKLDVEGLENVQKDTPYVVTVNHQSMVDVPLMYVLPFNFKWVAKREVYKIPIFGWVMYMHGDIGIDRASSKSGQKLMTEGHRWLKDGVSVIIFPEGTRTKNGDLGRFKDGAFLLAKSSEVAVLPCVIEGSKAALNGWRLTGNHTFTVRVLPPVAKEVVAETPVRELAEMVRQKTLEVYETIRK